MDNKDDYAWIENYAATELEDDVFYDTECMDELECEFYECKEKDYLFGEGSCWRESCVCLIDNSKLPCLLWHNVGMNPEGLIDYVSSLCSEDY